MANPPADKPLRVGASATVMIDTTKNENTAQDKK
jgi:hypothetical protein